MEQFDFEMKLARASMDLDGLITLLALSRGRQDPPLEFQEAVLPVVWANLRRLSRELHELSGVEVEQDHQEV